MKTGNKTPGNIDEYIAGFPPEIQKMLKAIRLTIKKAAPNAQETIRYQMPTFTLHGNLVHFAAFRKHIGFYPTPSAIVEFREDLAVYKGAKGSVQFPLDQPMPLELIGRIVRFRVAQQQEKAAARGNRKQP